MTKLEFVDRVVDRIRVSGREKWSGMIQGSGLSGVAKVRVSGESSGQKYS